MGTDEWDDRLDEAMEDVNDARQRIAQAKDQWDRLNNQLAEAEEALEDARKELKAKTALLRAILTRNEAWAAWPEDETNA